MLWRAWDGFLEDNPFLCAVGPDSLAKGPLPIRHEGTNLYTILISVGTVELDNSFHTATLLLMSPNQVEADSFNIEMSQLVEFKP